MANKPNPGSKEAIKLGCTCPRMDNGHGKGAYTDKEGPKFWIDIDCPIHGPKKGEGNGEKKIIEAE